MREDVFIPLFSGETGVSSGVPVETAGGTGITQLLQPGVLVSGSCPMSLR